MATTIQRKIKLPANIWVSLAGSTDGIGATVGNPVTIGRLEAMLNDMDTFSVENSDEYNIFIQPGTYNDNLQLIGDRFNARLRIRGNGGTPNDVVLRGTQNFESYNNIRVENLKFDDTSSPNNVATFTDCRRVEIDDIRLGQVGGTYGIGFVNGTTGYVTGTLTPDTASTVASLIRAEDNSKVFLQSPTVNFLSLAHNYTGGVWSTDDTSDIVMEDPVMSNGGSLTGLAWDNNVTLFIAGDREDPAEMNAFLPGGFVFIDEVTVTRWYRYDNTVSPFGGAFGATFPAGGFKLFFGIGDWSGASSEFLFDNVKRGDALIIESFDKTQSWEYQVLKKELVGSVWTFAVGTVQKGGSLDFGTICNVTVRHQESRMHDIVERGQTRQYFVDTATGDDFNDGAVGSPFATIQEAIERGKALHYFDGNNRFTSGVGSEPILDISVVAGTYAPFMVDFTTDSGFGVVRINDAGNAVVCNARIAIDSASSFKVDMTGIRHTITGAYLSSYPYTGGIYSASSSTTIYGGQNVFRFLQSGYFTNIFSNAMLTSSAVLVLGDSRVIINDGFTSDNGSANRFSPIVAADNSRVDIRDHTLEDDGFLFAALGNSSVDVSRLTIDTPGAVNRRYLGIVDHGARARLGGALTIATGAQTFEYFVRGNDGCNLLIERAIADLFTAGMVDEFQGPVSFTARIEDRPAVIHSDFSPVVHTSSVTQIFSDSWKRHIFADGGTTTVTLTMDAMTAAFKGGAMKISSVNGGTFVLSGFSGTVRAYNANAIVVAGNLTSVGQTTVELTAVDATTLQIEIISGALV